MAELVFFQAGTPLLTIVTTNFVYTTMCSVFCSFLLVSFYERIAELSRVLFFLLFFLIVTAGVYLGMTTGYLILEKKLVLVSPRSLALPVTIGVIASGVMTGYTAIRTHLDERIEKLRAAAQENEHLKRLESEARLASLQAKLDPHFLFNTLNSLAALVYDNPKKAEHGIIKLAEVYRHVLVISERQFVSAGEELDLIKDYLDLEKMRFDDLLSYAIHCPDPLKQVPIPGLLIEPLVGNVIKHALASAEKPVNIDVTLSRNERYVTISVKDNGIGFDPDKAVFGYGLKSVQERLQMLYRNDHTLTIDSSPGQGAAVTITFPANHTKAQESHED